MKIEMENELEPINMVQPDFWGTALDCLVENPDKVLPIYLKVDGSPKSLGNYFISFVMENKKIYVQAEGFDSSAMEIGFIIGSEEEWVMLQPGIYRLDVTDEI